MKTFLKFIFISSLGICVTANSAIAGNEKRAGQAGAQELLINPWSRSAGFGGMNTSLAQGVESMNSNVGGLGFMENTELIFSRTNWLVGSGISINSVGFAQGLKDNGTLGISVTSMSFGNIEIRTTDNPEGGLGTFNPQFLNIGLAYGKTFSKSIHTGVLLRIINESIADVSATGVALDAGVQYVTGENDKFKFGITLRNVGPTMSYRGVGLDFKTDNALNGSKITAQRRADSYELPTLLAIGLSRDFMIDGFNKITAMGNFTSNSFTNDQYTAGLQYAYRNYLMLRGSYTYENVQNVYYGNGKSTTPYNGIALGATFEIPMGDKGVSSFGIDYGYRLTYGVGPFAGTHLFGARLSF